MLIEQIIPFLIYSHREAYPKVYRSGGVGRTGVVLASWLVAQRGFSNPEALSASFKTVEILTKRKLLLYCNFKILTELDRS